MAEDVDVYYASRIWTGVGEPIENGVLVVQQGKVIAVGPVGEVDVPQNAIEHDMRDHVLIPGLVIAKTFLADSRAPTDRAVTPDVLALDGYDPFADRTAALSGGVTTVQISAGRDRLISGVGSVVKLTDGETDAVVLRENEGLRADLTSRARNAPTIYEPPVGAVSVDRPLEKTKPQLSSSLSGAAAGLRALLRAAQSKQGTDASDTIVTSLSDHMERDGMFRITANTAAEIDLASRLADEFGFDWLLVDPGDLTDLVDGIQSEGGHCKGVLFSGLSPAGISNPSPESVEDEVPPWASAKALITGGLPIAICPRSDGDLEDMLYVAGEFQQGGLTKSEVLSALTSHPARILGVDDRVGSLAEGRDADFVVLTSDPFSKHSYVLATYVGGDRLYERIPPASDGSPATTVIRADSIMTGIGTPINKGAIVVGGRTIRGVGQDVSAPLNAQVRDFHDAVIVPGFVDLGTGLGLGGSVGSNVSLQTKLGEQLFAEDPAIDIARRGGVTTVLLGATSNSPTPVIAFKLGNDARVVADPIAIKFRMTEDLVSRVPALRRSLEQGREYAQKWRDYDKALAEFIAAGGVIDESGGETDEADEDESEENGDQEEADDDSDDEESGTRRRGEGGTPAGGREGRGERRRERPADEDDDGDDEDADDEEEDKDDGEEGGEQDSDDKEEDADESEEKLEAPEKPEINASLEPYRALFAGTIPAFVEARRADAIRAALELFCGEFELRTVLLGADGLARDPTLLDGYEVAVCVGPELVVKPGQSRMNLPQLLANEQVPFAFQSEATTGVRDLSRAVRFAVNQGLGAGDAMQGLTSVPAELISQNASLGTIETGKDADLVVLSGPPFESSTRVLAVMIDGQWVYEHGKESDQ